MRTTRYDRQERERSLWIVSVIDLSPRGSVSDRINDRGYSAFLIDMEQNRGKRELSKQLYREEISQVPPVIDVSVLGRFLDGFPLVSVQYTFFLHRLPVTYQQKQSHPSTSHCSFFCDTIDSQLLFARFMNRSIASRVVSKSSSLGSIRGAFPIIELSVCCW